MCSGPCQPADEGAHAGQVAEVQRRHVDGAADVGGDPFAGGDVAHGQRHRGSCACESTRGLYADAR